jgi:hypothetical protein
METLGIPVQIVPFQSCLISGNYKNTGRRACAAVLLSTEWTIGQRNCNHIKTFIVIFQIPKKMLEMKLRGR